MKPEIHPRYKKINIIIGNDTFETFSTHHLNEYIMDVDYRKHPAWTGEGVNVVNQSNENVSKFNGKFGKLNFGVKI